MADLREFHGPNAGYVLELYERYRQDPGSVDPGWAAYFRSLPPSTLAAAEAPVGATAAPAAAAVDLERVLAAHELAKAIRARGHTAARLSPLGDGPAPDPALRPEHHGLSEADLESLPPAVVRGPASEGARSAAEAIRRLRQVYSASSGWEFDHIQDAEERAWFLDAVECGRYRVPLEGERGRALLDRLSHVEGFERYLHKAFFGQKRFSIEGTDMLVPILDEIIESAESAGTREVVIGMAHRGRLNVLTHVLGKPYAKMLAGFQGTKAGSEPPTELKAPDMSGGTSGDVKYHMGWRGGADQEQQGIRVTLAPNPSHLEFVNPVIVGMTRAAQDRTDRPGPPELEPQRALAVLVHGDAAFPGQGVVPETFNMSGLPGFTVGGTLHLIANNQVGFTTDPEQGRSTRYASDLAKGFEVPVVHVNADDPEACLAAARMAQAYRDRFGKDFVIDLVGYRRWGHNEGDEPSFTQPVMYEGIRTHPTVREKWADHLVRSGALTREEADGISQAVLDRLSRIHESLGAEGAAPGGNGRPRGATEAGPIETAVPAERLVEYNEALLRWPESFTPNARLAKLLERRRQVMGPEGGIDWGHAETLAFASLLAEGTPVRLTGQDVGRGTFSHRHQVLHDAATDAEHVPLAALPAARASFEIHNSPLSEMAVVGFEYGYSVADPQVLVLWEAQFGDFVNGAQVIIDQFLVASRAKWGQTSGLVLLLPHGYEGQGPEHSSARLERFLQLAAEDNVRVVNCTTSAQYFHLLRRQAALLSRDPRPLVVMSPKSLLRHPLAASRLEQLAEGRFHPVLVDETLAGREGEVTRLLLCTGKVYVDLVASGARAAARGTALVRVEELYPFPVEELATVLLSLPALQEVVWVQEEPRNMGAWSYAEPRLRALAGDRPVHYVGRPERSSPAEGSLERHSAEQSRIVETAWTGTLEPGSYTETHVNGMLIGKRK